MIWSQQQQQQKLAAVVVFWSLSWRHLPTGWGSWKDGQTLEKF